MASRWKHTKLYWRHKALSSRDFLEKTNKHAHPMIYMRGMKSDDLLAIIDFLYCGEADVLQENLNSFLSIAEQLQLKGLMGHTDENLENTSVDQKHVPPKKKPDHGRGSNGSENFKSRDSLRKHLKKQHQKPLWFFFFRSRHVLRLHRMRHHKTEWTKHIACQKIRLKISNKNNFRTRSGLRHHSRQHRAGSQRSILN